jgi:L-aminopeptidase/D-esterase-like protein
MNRKEKVTAEIKFKKGKFARGEKNSITDINGVKAGHFTVNKDVQEASGEKTSIRTGLTAILPYQMDKEMRLFAGSFVLRGKNEITGYEVMDDFCYLNSPLVITNSFNVGRAYNAILTYGFSIGRYETWPPFVIDINDSYLNDMRKSFLDEKEILNTFHNASSGKVEEGSVGIGLGLRAFGWKGGIGTSSRIFYLGHQQFCCGVLVASNYGNQNSLEKPKTESNSTQNGDGSLIIIVGVDIPLVPYQIKLITSSLVSSLSSVNISNNCLDSISCILFSTANPMSMEKEGPSIYEFRLVDDSLLAEIILAGTEAIKEAIFNSLLKTTPVKGRLGRKIETIPDNEFKKLLKEFGGVYGRKN